jgi:hypothetical protein
MLTFTSIQAKNISLDSRFIKPEISKDNNFHTQGFISIGAKLRKTY